MRVLVACEHSGVVRDAFRKRGHDAWSCDLLPPDTWERVVFADELPDCSDCGEEPWCTVHNMHYGESSCLGPTQDDVLYKDIDGELYGSAHIQGDLLQRLGDGWDLMIAHPPCTHLSASGAKHFEGKRADGRQRKAIEFFRAVAEAPIERICIENPVGIMSTVWRKPNQIIQPYQFGDPYKKTTCLWLKGLHKLRPTLVVEPRLVRYEKKDGSGHTTFSVDYGGSYGSGKRRSITYHGIADVMADQWG